MVEIQTVTEQNQQAENSASYTYNPTQCQDHNLNQMRFELGDTDVRGKDKTAVLCDEEYKALIKDGVPWNRAKLACLDAIMIRMSYEVDTKIGPLSYSFAARADRWMNLRDKLRRQLSGGIPCGNTQALNGPAYFYPDMLSNHRKG
jgi:hypothetical protein